MTAIVTVFASEWPEVSEVSIRAVTTGDPEHVLGAVADLTACAGARERRRWTGLLTRTDARVLVAEHAGQIVGIGSIQGRHIGEIDILVRDPTSRVARALAGSCMDAAHELGASVLIGKVCPPSEQAAALYEDLGFRLVQTLQAHDEIEGGSWADVHVFALALDGCSVPQ
jgi:L-amino acid N-acyltransferase YncA